MPILELHHGPIMDMGMGIYDGNQARGSLSRTCFPSGRERGPGPRDGQMFGLVDHSLKADKQPARACRHFERDPNSWKS